VSLPFVELARVSSAVAEAGGRNDKVALLAELLARAPTPDIAATVAFLTGTTPWGRIGVGWAVISAARGDPADEPSLTVADVTAAIAELTTLGGEGSAAVRRARVSDLLAAATASEQHLLTAVFGGELRQGAQAGVMTSAIASAASVPVTSVRRAAMMAGDLTVAALAALTGGLEALDSISLVPLRPIQPMLASPGSNIAEALGDGGPQVVEAKLDGARIQAHRGGDVVRLYTRNLNDVTERLPGIVNLVERLPGGDLVLDGEVLGLAEDESPRRFQDTMGDFGADEGAGRGAELRAFFFDLLLVDGQPIHDTPFEQRRARLDELIPANSRPASIVTADAAEAGAFLDRVIADGHEGVVVKELDHLYEAGRRGAAWRKVKPVHTLDLVVIGVEWGHGRRTGTLSNLHLAARPTDGSSDLVMVGKTFKGMTDEMLAWQTARFLGLETSREGHVVHVVPEQVVEVAVDGVQISTRYGGGIALRFARVKGYRHDKSADEADTIDAVVALL
jgi:DNA ligase-1